MILLIAVLAGLFAGLARAWLGGRSFQLNPPNYFSILLLATFFQALAFHLPSMRDRISLQLVAIILVTTQVCLLVFVWLNRNQAGFWIIGVGLFLNLLVIVLNGGLMPLSPEVASQIVPNTPSEVWEVGTRFGWSKDILLERTETRLWWLSDFLLSPDCFSYRFAFSPGDVLIAIGAFWFLWTRGGPQKTRN